MSSPTPRLLVTGATGQLGRLVIANILERKPDADVTAMVRNVASAADLADLGVTVVAGDYKEPASLDAAFVGVDRLLLISSNDLGARVAQHKNVIDAAKRAGVKLVILHEFAARRNVDARPRKRAPRNGARSARIWYCVYQPCETVGIRKIIPPGSHPRCNTARYSDPRQLDASRSAMRNDYAAAAATVLIDGAGVGETFELAGDDAFTRAEFAQAVAHQSGTPVTYTDLPPAEYTAALISAGLPAEIANLLSDSDAAAAHGALYDDSRTLSRLIGRPTTPLATAVAAALAGAGGNYSVSGSERRSH